MELASRGGVIRREDGSWYLGYSFKTKARDPVHAELLAIRHGLKLAKEFGIKNLQVAMDALMILQMFKEVEDY